ncbi:MAG: trigger factor [Negativicutes bacterium]|jgi:trigger factor
MKTTVTKLENNKVEINFELSTEKFDKVVNAAVAKVAQQVNIPGFRKGKAPRRILEKHVGSEALLQEAYELAAVPAFKQAIIDEKLAIVARPEFEMLEMAEGQPLKFKATVTVKPEATLGEYKAIKVDSEVKEVTEDAIDKYIENIRNRFANLIVCEPGTEVQKGDTAVIDFEGFVDGIAFPGGEGKSYQLEIGSNSFIPGFEEQVIGAKAGDVRDVEVVFPAEYHSEDLAGKAAFFKVTVHDVKRKELPELNDEFAKDASDFETLAEFREDVRRILSENAKVAAEREFDNAVIKIVLGNAKVEIPQEMIEDKTEEMLHDFSRRIEGQGIKIEQYLEYTGSNLEALKAQYTEGAAETLKYELTMEAIAKAENIEVSDLEMGEELEKIAAQHKLTADKAAALLRKNGRFEEVRESILLKKAKDFVLASAKA